jgi:hypothetical protein
MFTTSAKHTGIVQARLKCARTSKAALEAQAEFRDELVKLSKKGQITPALLEYLFKHRR